MTLSPIDAVRLKSSDKSAITREEGIGDGDSVYFKLGHAPIISNPDIQVRINDVTTTAFTMDYANGIVVFDTPPLGEVDGVHEADDIEFIYYWSIFSDVEVQYFVDEAEGNITVATARLLLAIAADASKVAQRQSLAGGGGLGAVTIDTSVTARELRATASALVAMEAELSETIPADGLTEPAWTEGTYQQGVDQNLIRNS